MDDLTKIAEADLGFDRDNNVGTTREFYKNPEGLIFFRDAYNVFHEDRGYRDQDSWEKAWEKKFSDFEPYNGKMTLQEIINHPDWALDYENLAIKERPCKMNLEKIAETSIERFNAFYGLTLSKRGPALHKTEYFECGCCGQVYWRAATHLEETGVCIYDSGYEPEVKFTKEEIIANAHKPNLPILKHGLKHHLRK